MNVNECASVLRKIMRVLPFEQFTNFEDAVILSCGRRSTSIQIVRDVVSTSPLTLTYDVLKSSPHTCHPKSSLRWYIIMFKKW